MNVFFDTSTEYQEVVRAAQSKVGSEAESMTRFIEMRPKGRVRSSLHFNVRHFQQLAPDLADRISIPNKRHFGFSSPGSK